MATNEGTDSTNAFLVPYEDDVLQSTRVLEGTTVEERINSVKEMKFREGDVFVCTFMKCGTHWIGNLICRLLTTPENPVVFQQPFIVVEGVPTNIVDQRPSPRVLFSHLHPKRIPQEHLNNRGKIVLCLRNPKDVAASLFCHFSKQTAQDCPFTWDQFLPPFIAGHMPYRGYLDYVLDWEKFANKNKTTVLVVFYEDLKKDGLATLRKIAKHLGVEKSDGELNQALAECSIDKLREEDNKLRPPPPPGVPQAFVTGVTDKEGKSVIYRKGEVGDWKNHFTVAQSEGYDQEITKKLANCSFQFTYEM